MARSTRGFTLVELMIVVAIIGILAAIAIPNFVRYQLRSKAGERRINLEAIYKAQEALRQSERVAIGGTMPGQYIAFGPLPAACNPSAAKQPWVAADLTAAQQVDWIIQGNTYACYQSQVTMSAAGVNAALGLCAWSDIDADGVQAADGLWVPQIDRLGAVVTPAPVVTCGGGNVDLSFHGGAHVLGADPIGRPVALSGDGVF